MPLKSTFIRIFKWTAGIILGLMLVITALLYIFQDRICNMVLTELGKEFREPVYFSTVDLTFWSTFPNLSINVNDVKIHDAYETKQSKAILLKSERIRLVFNPIDLWRENYHIKVIEIGKGEINVRTAKNGEVNYLILNPSNDTSTATYEVKVSSVHTKNFKVNYLNRQNRQEYCSTLNDMEFSGDFDQKEFTLNAKGGMQLERVQSGSMTLLKHKPVSIDLKLTVDSEQGTFLLPASQINVAHIPFTAGGYYGVDSMRFEVKADQLSLTDFVNNLSLDDAEKEINQYKGSGEVKFDLVVAGSTIGNNPPTIDCAFSIKDGHLIEPIKHTHIKNLKVNGEYISNGDLKNDRLALNQLSFKTAAGPFTGNLEITNFDNPSVVGKAKGSIDLSIANRLIRNDIIERMDGIAKINSEFSLTINENVNVKRVQGALSLYNVWFKAKQDHRTFENINGRFTLNGSKLSIDGATLAVNQSDLEMNGSFENIFNYMANKGNLGVNCTINSHQIIVEDLGKTTKEEKRESKGKSFVLPNNINGEIRLDASSITYEKHKFEQVTGPILISGRNLSFPSLHLKNAGSDIAGSLTIEENNPERFEISTNLRSDNIFFNTLFKEWDNFDQEVINANQISGRAQVEVSFYAPFNLIGGIDLNAMEVNAHMKVFNGHLKNVQSLEDIANSLRTNAGKLLIGKKNLDVFQAKLKDVGFSTLENTLQIRGGVITIPNMHISSSAMELDLSGTHTFENMIDYRMKFDFRDLLGEDRDSEFGTVIDDNTGLKVFLRMYGNIDNPTIEWDKTGRKQDLKDQIVHEKETVKSMLKSEFGLFKKDSTVQDYKPKTESKEVVKLNFKDSKSEKADPKPTDEVKQPQKEGKLKNTLNQWKQQQNQSNVVVTVRKG